MKTGLLAFAVLAGSLGVAVVAGAGPKKSRPSPKTTYQEARDGSRAAGLARFCDESGQLRACFGLSKPECETALGAAYDANVNFYNQSSMEDQWDQANIDASWFAHALDHGLDDAATALIGKGKLDKARCPHGVLKSDTLPPETTSLQKPGKPDARWDARYGYRDAHCSDPPRPPEHADLLCPGECGNQTAVTVKKGVLEFDVAWTVGSAADPKAPLQRTHVKLPITASTGKIVEPLAPSPYSPEALVDQVIPVPWTNAAKREDEKLEWFDRVRVFARFNKLDGSSGTGKGRIAAIHVFPVREDGALADKVDPKSCAVDLESADYKDREFTCVADGQPCGASTMCCGHCTSDSWEKNGVCK
ncbi:MAG TPA: hypothetical protein VGM88_31725 [Kofleriaceae bacterium]|jgi:hypothetical protein